MRKRASGIDRATNRRGGKSSGPRSQSAVPPKEIGAAPSLRSSLVSLSNEYVAFEVSGVQKYLSYSVSMW